MVFKSANSFGSTFFGRGRSSAATGIFPISTGRSMWVAPGFSLSAYLKERRTISLIFSGFTTILVRLVMGSNILVRFRNWCEVMCIRSVPTWPVIATSGAPSESASATPVTRLVAPGPSVARHTPACPVSLP